MLCTLYTKINVNSYIEINILGPKNLETIERKYWHSKIDSEKAKNCLKDQSFSNHYFHCFKNDILLSTLVKTPKFIIIWPNTLN